MSEQKSEIVLCLLPLIESGTAGLPVDAAAADLIAACARFNIQMADMKADSKLGEDGWLQILEAYEDLTQKCKVAVQGFSESSDCMILVDRLREITEQLNNLAK